MTNAFILPDNPAQPDTFIQTEIHHITHNLVTYPKGSVIKVAFNRAQQLVRLKHASVHEGPEFVPEPEPEPDKTKKAK
jgi:hypothetical protein